MIPSGRFTKPNEMSFCECLQLRKNVIFMQRENIEHTHSEIIHEKLHCACILKPPCCHTICLPYIIDSTEKNKLSKCLQLQCLQVYSFTSLDRIRQQQKYFGTCIFFSCVCTR